MHAFPKGRFCPPCCLDTIIKMVGKNSLHPKQNSDPTKAVLLPNFRSNYYLVVYVKHK